MNDQEIPTEPVQNEAAVKSAENAEKQRKQSKVLDKKTEGCMSWMSKRKEMRSRWFWIRAWYAIYWRGKRYD